MLLASAGFVDARHLEGGLHAWLRYAKDVVHAPWDREPTIGSAI
jgi:hypothetical protein